MQLMISMKHIMNLILNFITDSIKTTITSLASISFGLLDIQTTNNVLFDFTTKMLQNVSLILGAIVAIFAIINGIFTLITNIENFKCKRKVKKLIKKKRKGRK